MLLFLNTREGDQKDIGFTNIIIQHLFNLGLRFQYQGNDTYQLCEMKYFGSHKISPQVIGKSGMSHILNCPICFMDTHISDKDWVNCVTVPCENPDCIAKFYRLKDNSDCMVIVGSHSITHARLEFLDQDRLQKEVVESKNIIENRMGNECKYICYPNGSYSDVVIDAARECGYKAGLTTDTGFNSIGDDLFRLKRIGFPMTMSKLHVLAASSGLFVYRDKLLAGLKKLFSSSRQEQP